MGKRLSGRTVDAMLRVAEAKGVRAAAEQFGVSERTVVRRRAIVEQQHNACEAIALQEHTDQLSATFGLVLQRLAELIPEAGMVETLEAVKTLGELKLAHDALLGEVTGEGASDPREGTEAPENSQSLQGPTAGQDPATAGQFYQH